MNVPRPLSHPATICIAFLAFACSKEIQREPRQNLVDGKYDSEFPTTPTSALLGEISESIFTVNCIGSYRTFAFDEGKKITAADISGQLLDQMGPGARFSDNSVRGTATVIFNDGHKMAFLTCAHNITMPDTVISFYRDLDRRLTKYVQSVAVKVKQFNFISPLPERRVG